jgi:hypothetical protein
MAQEERRCTVRDPYTDVTLRFPKEKGIELDRRPKSVFLSMDLTQQFLSLLINFIAFPGDLHCDGRELFGGISFT